MAPVQRSYRYRLDPTAKQRRQLEKLASARRFVWNWALETRVSHYQTTGKRLARGELGRALTRLKETPQHVWLAEADSQSLQQALDDLNFAFNMFFERKAGFPRFKSRKRDRNRFRIPQRCVLKGDRVQIPKVGLVRLRLSREPLGRLGAATFKEDAAGHWHVTFVVHHERTKPKFNPVV